MASSSDPGSALGQHTWWAGPLDAEAFVLAAIADVARAVQELPTHRGGTWTARVDVDRARDALTIIERYSSATNQRAFAELSSFFACRDGWVRLHGNYRHHADVIADVLGAKTADQVTEAVADERAADVESAIVAGGACAAAVRSGVEWDASAPGRVLAEDPVVITDWADTPGAPLPSAESPLAGVRVIDFTRVLAGPIATAVLSALGADVTRIDPPDLPEDPVVDAPLNGGKKRWVRDLAFDADLAAVRSALSAADVVVLGYRPGALARFGMDPESLRRDYPSLTIASVSAWGRTGPWADRRGFDSIVQAATGIAALYADDEAPGRLPIQALDHAAGYYVAASVVRGLAHRAQRGAATSSVSLARLAVQLRGQQRSADAPLPDDAPRPPSQGTPRWRSPVVVY